MKISVIISAYNRRDFLLRAVNSVANQTLDKNLYEVIVVKNFEDKSIDETLNKLGYKNVVYDTPRYGERVAIGIEESSGDILAFLEDDDEFKPSKLTKVHQVFNKYKDVYYFHDTREYIYCDEVVDMGTSNPDIRNIIRDLEEITPHNEVIIDPFDKDIKSFLIKYHGIVATTSLMAVRRECMNDKLDLLKRIEISLENFIPAFSAECGKIYHTGERLTRYRIHNKNTSIGFTHEDQIRVLENFMRSISDGELIINNISRNNQIRNVVKLRLLEARYLLYNSPKDIKGYLKFDEHLINVLKDILELCRLRHSFKECKFILLFTLYNSLPSETLKRIIRSVRRSNILLK
ncbi:glycosyltransferase family 2 protein [Stygiolobus sp. CP850M]|uniref:glycosyltransferase family 2 protein n=1 Tax=Stygiolobus sp. CP850M TaxID=3133134 RepID=UPI00307D1679